MQHSWSISIFTAVDQWEETRRGKHYKQVFTVATFNLAISKTFWYLFVPEHISRLFSSALCFLDLSFSLG